MHTMWKNDEIGAIMTAIPLLKLTATSLPPAGKAVLFYFAVDGLWLQGCVHVVKSGSLLLSPKLDAYPFDIQRLLKNNQGSIYWTDLPGVDLGVGVASFTDTPPTTGLDSDDTSLREETAASIQKSQRLGQTETPFRSGATDNRPATFVDLCQEVLHW